MRTREDLLKQLRDIEAEALSVANPFELTGYDESNLRTVIITMIHIVEYIDNIKNRDGLYSAWGIAPIHLENHRDIQFKFEIDLEKTLFISLVEPFIDNYYKMKGAGHKHINYYCSNFEGNCIDGRTRAAFEYAFRMEHGATFTSHIIQAKKALPKATMQTSYCWIFASILKSVWTRCFIADVGANGFMKKDGQFNVHIFPKVDAFLREITIAPTNDFLLAYQSLPNNLKGLYFRLLFSLPEFATLDFSAAEDALEEMKIDEKFSKKIRRLHYASQQLFDNFFLDTAEILLHLVKANQLKTTFFCSLLNNTSAPTLLALWGSPTFAELLSTLTPFHYALIFKTLLNCIKKHKDHTEALLKTPLFNQNTIIHLAAKTDDISVLIETIGLSILHGISIWSHNNEGDSAIVSAAKDKCWNCIPPFLGEEKQPEIEEVKSQECKKALVYVAERSQWDVAKQMINAGTATDYFHPDTGFSIIHYSLLKNEPELLDTLVEAKADVNQATREGLTPLIAAATETKVTLDTFAYFLTKPGIEINTKHRGESALFITARTNQVDKLLALLSLNDIDVEAKRLPGDGLTAIEIAAKNNNDHATNILKLYELIHRLLNNKLCKKEDTQFLHSLKPQLIEDLFDAVTRKRKLKKELIDRAQLILQECILFIHAEAPKKPLTHPPLSFVNNYQSTTTALSQLFTFVGLTTEPHSSDWQTQVRSLALKELETAAEACEDADQRKALLKIAREEPIFKEHRGEFFFSRIGRTGAQIKIDELIQAPPKKSKRR